uniref:Uncharacterized protein n=1 Tax=Phlebotomus papatasi TaxID=29031 RepID=A0A1B0D8P4_PHLPP
MGRVREIIGTTIGRFYKKYSKWTTFYDTFRSTVHENSSISPVQKLQYLKRSLKGEAEGVLKNMAITEANYEIALDMLKKDYDKKTHIVTAHIEKFIKQSQEKVRSGSASSIKKACNTYKEILEALEVLGDDCTTRDVWLIHFMKQNMDDETQRLWASKLSCHKIPNLTEWFDFLKGRIDSMEMYKKEDSNTTQEKSKVKTHLTSTAKCLKCSQDHSLKECEEFNRLSVDARRKFVNDNSTCFNCLKGSHRAKDCRGKMKCQSCGKRHNTLLHLDNGASTGKIETQKEEQSMTSKKPSDSGTVKTHHAVGFKKSVLPTAQVYVEDVEGNLQKCRLLIDQGGECSFVSEALVQRLGLKRQNARVEVQATSEVSVGYTKGLVQIKMSSRYDDRKIISVDAYILSKLTTELPAREVDRREVEFFGNILLADPDFYKPGQIDMILGIEYAMSIITPGMFMTQPGKPVAQNTIFGYVIGGLFDEKESTNVSSYHVRCNLDAIVQRFWEVEDQVMDKRQHMTPEEELCEEQFQNTHTRDETGRYIVRLPFKDDKNKLATRTLAQVANDYEEKYPKASEAIRRGFYMDDLLYGARLEEDAIKLKNQIQEVLQEGGFRLRKWTSNSIQVLGTIDEADRAISQEEVYDSKSIMALGLNWTPGSDEFSIVIQVPEKAMTKRQLLSETAKIFDPLGIITPVTIRFKIMYQKMWLISKDWDTALPEEVKNEYDKLRSEFGLLREVKVPRFIPCSDEEIELHCFSDASEEAYGVVIFARFKTPDGQVMINQVAAKSRVCPLKSTSIPRLELRAAALLTNLLKKIQDAVNPLKVKKVMWTDSTIVLQWLQSHPRRWKQFVANKTSDILEVTTPQDWRYVPTSDNPADCVSRGVSPKELIHHSLWWQGPPWLKQDEEHWPQNKVIIPQDTDLEQPCPSDLK